MSAAANAKLQDLNYTRNLAGIISRINSTTGTVANDAARSWTYGYDLLDRLITADNDNGTAEDRSFRYDDADNMLFNSTLCSGTADNLVYPAQGPASVRPHAPISICGVGVAYDANGNTLSYDVDGATGPI